MTCFFRAFLDQGFNVVQFFAKPRFASSPINAAMTLPLDPSKAVDQNSQRGLPDGMGRGKPLAD